MRSVLLLGLLLVPPLFASASQAEPPAVASESTLLRELASLKPAALSTRLRALGPVETFRLAQRALLLGAGVGGKPSQKMRRLHGRLAAHLRDGLTTEERTEILKLPELLLPDARALTPPLRAFEVIAANDTMLDYVLGMAFAQTERTLQRSSQARRKYRGQETYIDWHLTDHALQTSYEDLRLAFEAIGLKPGDRVVDLGSGYGRVGFWIAMQHPGVSFTGYELVTERVRESQRIAERFGWTGAECTREGGPLELIEQDLTAPGFRPSAARVYLAYDPVAEKLRTRVLEDLRAIASELPIVLIAFEGQGSFLAALRKEPWLTESRSLPSVRPVGFPMVLFESKAP